MSASGTTARFTVAYCGGMPSYALKRSNAAAPRFVLWGTMPRTVRHSMRAGAA